MDARSLPAVSTQGRWTAVTTIAALLGALAVPAWAQSQGQTNDGQQTTPPADAAQKSTARPVDPLRLAELERLLRAAEQLYDAGNAEQAITAVEKALAIQRELFGKEEYGVAILLSGLANWRLEREDFDKARLAAKEALEIQTKLLGKDHWLVTNARLALADVDFRSKLGTAQRQQLREAASLDKEMSELFGAWRFSEAVARGERAVAICRAILDQGHPDYAASLTNLAALYHAMGDYARAEPLYKEALEITKQALGEAHPVYSTNLQLLASMYRSTGDYARAEPLDKQALEITKKALGESHPYYATRLKTLAELYHAMRDYARAEPLLKQALEIERKTLGETDPVYAASLVDLAKLYLSMGDSARGEPLLKQALEIRKRTAGEAHSADTDAFNVASLYHLMGDYARAEPLYKQALETEKKTLGVAHPNYAASLNNLAMLYDDMGDYARAEPLALLGLQIRRRHLDQTAAVQSERQQLANNAAVRGNYLDLYLTIAAAAGSKPGRVYDQVLGWKGAISARQSFSRQLRDSLSAKQRLEVAPLYESLQRATRELGARSRMTPSPAQQEAHRTKLAELSQEIEGLEQQLARTSADFRKQLAQRERTGEELADALPQEVALADLLEYWHYTPQASHPGKGSCEWRIVAFVVRRDKPLVRVELGPAAPIEMAVIGWRATHVPNESGDLPADLPADPDDQLRRLVWDKLAQHVEGSTTLLISPDGVLARFPWAALPTSAGRYLIEDKQVVIVPIPSMLPELLLAEPSETDKPPSLLLVGDVNYGATPGAPIDVALARSAPRNTRAGLLRGWEALSGTGPEAVTVRDSFAGRFQGGKVTMLEKEQPTEERLREAAPDCQYLHLATHGYFAPPELRSALAATSLERGGLMRDLVTRQDVAGYHPGLLSGIVLAGANHEVAVDQDDGILTALEVAELDLRGVQVATLSACETGLGESAGGEGLLGLQRAFQVAGARTTVASLWKVNDAATRTLMSEFYNNLWQKKLSRIEALRQAQLTMLRRYDVKDGVLRGAGTPAAIDPKKLEEARQRGERVGTAPRYWAAFVLSGDWR